MSRVLVPYLNSLIKSSPLLDAHRKIIRRSLSSSSRQPSQLVLGASRKKRADLLTYLHDFNIMAALSSMVGDNVLAFAEQKRGPKSRSNKFWLADVDGLVRNIKFATAKQIRRLDRLGRRVYVDWTQEDMTVPGLVKLFESILQGATPKISKSSAPTKYIKPEDLGYIEASLFRRPPTYNIKERNEIRRDTLEKLMFVLIEQLHRRGVYPSAAIARLLPSDVIGVFHELRQVQAGRELFEFGLLEGKVKRHSLSSDANGQGVDVSLFFESGDETDEPTEMTVQVKSSDSAVRKYENKYGDDAADHSQNARNKHVLVLAGKLLDSALEMEPVSEEDPDRKRIPLPMAG